MKSLVIIIPVFNEAEAIINNLSTVTEYTQSLPEFSINILIVDDGSTDETVKLVRKMCLSTDNLFLLSLNRNFGKEAAILAGLNLIEKSDAVIIMDSDLQHPPSLLSKMIKLWDSGYDVVEACKSKRENETLKKNILVRVYYYIFNIFTDLSINNQSDFKLLDKKVIQQYCQFSEQDRFFRGLVKWMNYSTTQIYFDVPCDHKDHSSWTNRKLIKYAISSITSFSSAPLQIVTVLGCITFIVSLIMGSIALFQKFSGQAVDGFTTVILLILFIGSLLMFSLGLIGVYISKIYSEVKNRPVYIINNEDSYLKDSSL